MINRFTQWSLSKCGSSLCPSSLEITVCIMAQSFLTQRIVEIVLCQVLQGFLHQKWSHWYIFSHAIDAAKSHLWGLKASLTEKDMIQRAALVSNSWCVHNLLKPPISPDPESLMFKIQKSLTEPQNISKLSNSLPPRRVSAGSWKSFIISLLCWCCLLGGSHELPVMIASKVDKCRRRRGSEVHPSVQKYPARLPI